MEEVEYTTTAGTQEYALPTDFAKLDLIRENQQYLTKTSLKELKIRIKNFTQGIPNRYYIYKNNF